MESVLFVCVENAGRSLMAEAFMKKYAPHVRVASAGTRPATRPNNVVVQAMREVGIELDKTPAALTPKMLKGGALVVNMGCMDRQECPALFADDAADWAIPDPKGRDIQYVRRIRDMIEARVKEMAGCID